MGNVNKVLYFFFGIVFVFQERIKVRDHLVMFSIHFLQRACLNIAPIYRDSAIFRERLSQFGYVVARKVGENVA